MNIDKSTKLKSASSRTLILLTLLSLLSIFQSSAEDKTSLVFKEIAHLKVSHGSSIAWSPDGTQLAVVDYPSIRIFNTISWASQLTISDAEVSEAVWSPDGTKLGSVQGGDNESVLIWDAGTGNLDRHLIKPYNGSGKGKIGIYRLSWSPSGNKIASDSMGLNLLIWDLSGNEEIHSLEGHLENGVTETDWSPDSSQIVSGGADGTIRIWDASNGKNVITVAGGGFVDWHPTDNKIVGTGLDNDTCIWDTILGKELLCVEHGNTVLSVRWNFDGSLIATGDLDGVIKVWDAQSGEPVITIPADSNLITMVAWHPTQNLLASASLDGDMRIHDLTK